MGTRPRKAEARDALKNILKALDQKRKHHNLKFYQPELDARIRSELNMPLRADGLATLGDGDCLFAALKGRVPRRWTAASMETGRNSVYRCPLRC